MGAVKAGSLILDTSSNCPDDSVLSLGTGENGHE
jgi:hypothetical protein